jgi:predicted nucleic-acid-binding protein
MISLIDANVIIRFLVREESTLYVKSVKIIEQIEKGELKVEILSEVLMEVLFIMTKYYKAPLRDIIEDLKIILRLQGVVNENKYILINSLDMMVEKKIDYVDALICSKSKLQGYGKISFDKDVMKKCER